jgi:glutathione-specific gamma-glutamylcyclotransferase
MKRRQTHLTPDLVARVPPLPAGTPIAPAPEGIRRPTDADFEEIVSEILSGASSPEEVWVFAYGSLIWNPGFDFEEQRIALANGWHRSFCLGWDMWFRGCADRPGLMLSLDRGGRCKGVAYRLPPRAVEAALMLLVRRETHAIPNPHRPRWINLMTQNGPLRAVTYAVERNLGGYVGGLRPEEVADVLAVAAGQWGSMAEYLLNTVSRLEELGLHDSQLWHLQELVAARIEAIEAPVGQLEGSSV